MSEHGTQRVTDDLQELFTEHPYLESYLQEEYEEYGEYPIVVDMEDVDDYESKYPNIVYKISESVFVHIYGDRGVKIMYNVIEPPLENEALYSRIRDKLLKASSNHPAPRSNDKEEIQEYLDVLLDDVLISSSESGLTDKIWERVGDKVIIDDSSYNSMYYNLRKSIVGMGGLTPLLDDVNNEDIHIIGTDKCTVDHSAFGLINTDVSFGTEREFDQFIKNLGERMNNPISDSQPIVDATLPDGSRINIVYSDDVSVKGSSITIRQGEEVPLSILQITKWGTLSPKMAAYLWICLENEQTVFVVGETASGKTTTLNSIMSFIPNSSKIYTAEDTAEVDPPQDTWQQLLTRESPDESSTDVTMFDLVATSLRARPDYIIVGEVRGEEARMAFQAAQTGHPVMLTFHASDVNSMIQRFTGDPLNVPETFIPNADVALFQNRVKTDDGDILRRVTSVSEILGYDDEEDGVISQEVFRWDSADDEHEFLGMYNSYVLENQIAELLGYEDKTKIYDELERRTKIINRLIENDILEYNEVNNVIDTIQQDGVESLHINTAGLSE
jgi:flagellar protein FlaI